MDIKPKPQSTSLEQPKTGPLQLNQREAVFIEVAKIIKEERVQIPPKSSVKKHLTEAHLRKLYNALMSGFKSAKIRLKTSEANKKKLADSKLLEVYVVGLVNNWLRRDKRLNGTMDTKF